MEVGLEEGGRGGGGILGGHRWERGREGISVFMGSTYTPRSNYTGF